MRSLPLLPVAALAAFLAGCAPASRIAPPDAAMVRAYAPPGVKGDPWGPFVREASAESGVAEPVLYAVMWAESRGCQWLNGKPMTAKTGEAGLMQIPPSIYQRFRAQTRLPIGADPWVPRDNIRFAAWALARYIRQYGMPVALAAYQYGPTELDTARRTGRALPAATVTYQRDVWADAHARAAKREAGRHWTDPDRIVCTWDGH